jgi:hypothetical protein
MPFRENRDCFLLFFSQQTARIPAAYRHENLLFATTGRAQNPSLPIVNPASGGHAPDAL